MSVSSNTGYTSGGLIELAAPLKNFYWYAIRVRPRFEKAVASAIREKGYDGYLPLYCKRTRWSDRSQDVYLPLFPAYVFCRADLSGRSPLVTTPGVIGILSFGGSPAIITDQEINAIKAALCSGLHAEPWPYLREGQRVRIQRGSLTGIEGILVRKKSNWWVVLSIEVLYRSVALEIDREWVMPVSSRPGH
jgi:transcription antitermination factor NusG